MRKRLLISLVGIILIVTAVLSTGSGYDRFVFAGSEDMAEDQQLAEAQSYLDQALPYEALELFAKGYTLYEKDPQFEAGILESQRMILNWSLAGHRLGQLEAALSGYSAVIKSPSVDKYLFRVAGRNKLRAEKQEPVFEAADYFKLGKESLEQNKPYFALEVFSEGDSFYPDTRLKAGLVKSADMILAWSKGGHLQGDFENALKGYTEVIQNPRVPANVKREAEYLRSYAITEMPYPSKVAYLTFDDGPSPNTEKILDILKHHQLRATFFVNGRLDQPSKAVYRRIAEEGHVLGNHTFSHRYNTIYSSVYAYQQDFDQLQKLLADTTGFEPDIMRFPGGSNTNFAPKIGGKKLTGVLIKKYKELGYQYFDWNVTGLDAVVELQPKEIIVDSVLKGAKDKDRIIVLLHDTSIKTTTPEALPEIIEGLRELGYRFEVLSKTSPLIYFQR